MIEQVLMILGALGGFEAIKYLLNFCIHRNTEKRKEKASAAGMEIANFHEVIENSEKRLRERDAKVDAIYKEFRTSQERCLELMSELNKALIEVEVLKVQKCEKRGCPDRLPPSNY